MKSKYRNSMKVISMAILFSVMVTSCKLPSPEKKEQKPRIKHNYIVLLDLSDRLIVQDNQPERDKQIIRSIYELFEDRVRQNLYIKSKDEIKVVIAPQLGSGLRRDVFEDRLYVNMENVKTVYRKLNEDQRKKDFFANVDTLYNKAVFSKRSDDYYGADIWKYFYEDLRLDYSNEELTENYLFIITDGYPIVGQNRNKLLQVKNSFPDLHIVLMEAAPREKDMEWDSVMEIWQQWFDGMGVEEYTLIKRGSITKELEEVKKLVSSKPVTLAGR